MKIEVKEKGSKEYYDELLYIVSNNILQKKHNKKIKRITTHAIQLGIISLLILIPFTVLYIIEHTPMYLIVIILFTICVILSVVYYILITRKIEYIANTNQKATLEINKEGITINAGKQYNHLDYKDIDNIIINKYSICFMSSTSQSLYTRIEYKDKVIEALTKYKQDKLIVDNTNLYK